ncbi:hypothetical protein AOL_s00007g332 [Orbilia oligospora ATCC 24927]|uniref:BTB domain-containing protein n=1 Tax=Arthrobotrys oligospora (strain ATCC 24927 / CBS 115.81 / DSM 1491) TaxID=756982 RepID=G1X223_ARTOA|nr:hypothetical protein AOL_s00007g332 [Orbilia oligospora ATCC 24927]EGX52996.1 hypothetical protein AOL_s00007g332 [Orbilia oligospora ATCC 24927]
MKAYSYTPIADLLVGLTDTKQQQHSFLVSSAALRMASPVWRKLLDPDSRFAPLQTVSVDGHDYRRITVEGVEPESLQILLGILHYSTGNIPKGREPGPVATTGSAFLKFNFSVLRDLALLLDQYDCVAVTSYFAEGWIDSGKGGELSSLWGPDYVRVGFEDWIFIASVFGRLERVACDNIIQLVSKELIRDICVDTSESNDIRETKYYRWKETQLGSRDAGADNGSQTVPVSQPIETREHGGKDFDLVHVNLEMVPQRVLDFILEQRLSTSYKILAPLYSFVQELLDSGTPLLNMHNDKIILCENNECSAMALGTLIQSLNQQGLNHLLTKNLTKDELLPPGRCSLQDLARKIQALQMTTFKIRNIHRKIESSDTEESIKNAVAVKLRSTIDSDIKVMRTPLSYTNRPIFLRDDRDIASTQSTAICPLALKLSKIKENAQEIMNLVEGYQSLEA